MPAGTALAAAPGALAFDGSKVRWSLGNIPPGRSGVLTFSVTILGEGPLIGPDVASMSSVSSLGTMRRRDSVPPVTVEIQSPFLLVVKRGPASGFTQDPVTFTIWVRNTGNGTAYDVTVTDTLPAGPSGNWKLTPVSWSPGATLFASGMLVWRLGALPPRMTVAASLTVTGQGPDAELDFPGLVNRVVADYKSSTGQSLGWVSDSCTFSLSPRLSFAAYPNPFKAEAGKTLKFKGLPAGAVVHIYTLTGMELRRLSGVASHRLEWDGKNEEGSAVTPGLYFYAVELPATPGATPAWKKGKIGLTR